LCTLSFHSLGIPDGLNNIKTLKYLSLFNVLRYCYRGLSVDDLNKSNEANNIKVNKYLYLNLFQRIKNVVFSKSYSFYKYKK